MALPYVSPSMPTHADAEYEPSDDPDGAEGVGTVKVPTTLLRVGQMASGPSLDAVGQPVAFRGGQDGRSEEHILEQSAGELHDEQAQGVVGRVLGKDCGCLGLVGRASETRPDTARTLIL